MAFSPEQFRELIILMLEEAKENLEKAPKPEEIEKTPEEFEGAEV